MHTIIKIEQGVPRMEKWQMKKPVDFELADNEHIAIVGRNASGKTMLVDMITGAHPLRLNPPYYDFSPSEKRYVAENIKYISFEDAYGTGGSHYYLQQRWNMHDIDEETPTAAKVLENEYRLSGEDTPRRRQLRDRLYGVFSVDSMLGKYIISLSSGELRKLHLVKNLLSSPRVLILDNPFIGLDAPTRDLLKELLGKLASEFSIQIILVLAKIDQIPQFITHVVKVDDMVVMPKMTKEQFLDETKHKLHARGEFDKKQDGIFKAVVQLPYYCEPLDAGSGEEIVRMNKVSVKYGSRTILKELDWTVKKGECWALNGQNGAGKSTLLSLVCADNPQSYACDIRLFGRTRGTGESIWEIKRHIGYVSPEMHRAYRHDIPAMRIVASGMKDSVGLYARPTEEEYARCECWMRIFGVEDLKDRNFLTLSSGEQRLILLARAFVKDPQLLILDEPFHGLDNKKRDMVRNIINAFSKRKDKTIIMVSHYQDEYPLCINRNLTLVRND